MFRLIRIRAGRINHAEPVCLPCDGKRHAYGEALTLKEGKLCLCPTNEKPSYIAAEVYAGGDVGEELMAYPITPEMEFDTPCEGGATSLILGQKVALTEDGMAVDATASGAATVLSLAYADEGIVTVAFQ